MNEDISCHLGKTRDNIDSILLLCNLMESGIEHGVIKSPWDLYLILDILKFLSIKSINNLRKVKY